MTVLKKRVYIYKPHLLFCYYSIKSKELNLQKLQKGIEELQKSMEPSRYIGCAPHQVERFLKDVIRPVLDANRDILGEKAEINV